MQFVESVRKSFRAPKLEDHIRVYNESKDAAKRKQAAWGIREQVEKRKNLDEVLRLGIVPIMIERLNEGGTEEKLWACWVLRFASQSEAGAPAVLQDSSGAASAIDGLVKCVTTLESQNSSTASEETGRRALDVIVALSAVLATQIFMARDDVFRALIAAMGARAPADAVAAARAYYNLSEARNEGHPHYLGGMALPAAIERLRAVAERKDVEPDDAAMARKTAEHLVQNAPISHEE